MSDGLLLPVEFEGQEMEFPLRLVQRGFQRCFVVEVAGTEIIFERDDANEVRAIVADPDKTNTPPPPAALVRELANVIALLG